MKRSPLIGLDPIAFIDSSLSYWPIVRPDGSRLVEGDLILVAIDDKVSNVYRLTDTSAISENLGDAWTVVNPDHADGQMTRALRRASKGLHDQWLEAWGQ